MTIKLQKQIYKACKGTINGYFKDFNDPKLNYRGANFTWKSFREMMMHRCQSTCWMANLGDIIPKKPEDYNSENPERKLTAEHKRFIKTTSKQLIDELFAKHKIKG